MGVFSGPEIVNDGLVFSYDMNNTAKSWKGKPTTNYAYNQNPRIDSSYAQWEPTADATWTANHPGRLVVYNDDGGAITGYINSGVNAGNWTVTHHAYWVYDDELKKPVVIMRDLDAQWKAKSWNMQQSMTSMGLAAGDTYTISWLQWTTNIGKSANAGLYGQNTSGQNNFHDGQSNAQTATAYNTKPYTWQRVYATFTVNAVRNMGATLSCYMYGYFGGRGVIKISDVQIEPGTVSGFSKAQTRSNTEGLKNIANNTSTITLDSPSYTSTGQFEFNGGTERINLTNIGGSGAFNNHFTISAWINSTDTSLTQNILSMNGPYFMRLVGSKVKYNVYAGSSPSWLFRTGTTTINSNTWYFLTMVWNGTANTWTGYINNVEEFSDSKAGPLAGNTNSKTFFGYVGYTPQGGEQSNFFGQISEVYYYNRALTANEVKQNFENTRGKYGV